MTFLWMLLTLRIIGYQRKTECFIFKLEIIALMGPCKIYLSNCMNLLNKIIIIEDKLSKDKLRKIRQLNSMQEKSWNSWKELMSKSKFIMPV